MSSPHSTDNNKKAKSPGVRELRKKIWSRHRPFPRLMDMAPEERDEYFNPISYKAAMFQMGTGDVLLFHGSMDRSDRFSRHIQGCSWFNHVAMIVKDPPPEILELYKCNVEEGRKSLGLFVFEVGLPKNGGTRLEPLQNFLVDYASRVKPTFVAWSRLSKCSLPSRAAEIPELVKLLKDAKNIPYEKKPLQFILGWAGRGSEDTSSLFCSECVAWALRTMGVFSPTSVPSTFMPVDFSLVQSPDRLSGVMVNGQFEQERQLVI